MHRAIFLIVCTKMIKYLFHFEMCIDISHKYSQLKGQSFQLSIKTPQFFKTTCLKHDIMHFWRNREDLPTRNSFFFTAGKLILVMNPIFNCLICGNATFHSNNYKPCTGRSHYRVRLSQLRNSFTNFLSWSDRKKKPRLHAQSNNNYFNVCTKQMIVSF